MKPVKLSATNYLKLQAIARQTDQTVDAVADGIITLHVNQYAPKVKATDLARIELVKSALRKSDGNVTKAAEYLGEHRRTVQRWMFRFGISREEFVQ